MNVLDLIDGCSFMFTIFKNVNETLIHPNKRPGTFIYVPDRFKKEHVTVPFSDLIKKC